MSRRSGEPPLVTGWPFIGVTLDYASNPLRFLRDTQKKHGDVFTCAIAGKYFTFVTDPFSFSAVVRQSKNLDFQKFALGFSRRVSESDEIKCIMLQMTDKKALGYSYNPDIKRLRWCDRRRKHHYTTS